MQIRQLKLDDVLEVNKIRNFYISNTNYIFRRSEKGYQDDYAFFEEVLEKDYPCVTLEVENEVLGFAYLYPFRALDGYDKTMELSIYLKPNIEKKGYGKLILEEIEKLSKDKYHVIVSVITSDNFNSIDFHKKRGFEIMGELKEVGFVNGTYLDATFMQKILYNSK